jgi:hypothetical protein
LFLVCDCLQAGIFNCIANNNTLLAKNGKELNSKQAHTEPTKGKRKKGMTLVHIDKRADFNLDARLVERFSRLQKDYNWILSNKNKLRSQFPDMYIAVENEKVRYTAATIDALMAQVSKNNEEIDNFAIEYISQHPRNLLF